MGRYIKKVELNQPIDIVSMLMDDYVYHNRFVRGDWNGEMVYFMKDSHGKERYLEWHYVDGELQVEAWLKSPFGKEQDLNGMGASKREFRESIENIIARLKAQSPAAVSGGHIGSDPLHHDSVAGTNHENWQRDTGWQQGSVRQTLERQVEGQAENLRKNIGQNPSQVIFAIMALFFGIMFPVIGIAFLVAALKKNEDGSRSQLVKTIAAIAIVVMAIKALFNVIIFMTRFLLFF